MTRGGGIAYACHTFAMTTIETIVPGVQEKATGSFFRRADWAAFWTVLILALGGYVATLAPTVTLEDSGELVVAADYLGVPHPPGYPIWTLGAWLFQWIFDFVRFHGHPNPAWGVAFFSAFSGAMACGLLALLVSRCAADIVRRIPRFDQALGARTEQVFCWVGGVAGGLLLAFSPVMWSQAVIAEVYSLNALFQMLVFVLLYRWMCRPQERGALYVMAFAFGLGLTNHQTLLFVGVALALGIMVREEALFRDFVVTAGAMAAVGALNWAAGKFHLESLSWVAGPSQPGFWITTALVVGIPLAAAWVLPNGRTVCLTILLAELGLAFYAFMPFASEQNPPMNWGYPRTWEGFIHAVSRGQYEAIKPTELFSSKFIEQFFGFLTSLRQQFSLPLLLAGFIPFTAWQFNVRRRRLRALPVALGLTLVSLVFVALEHVGDQGDPLAAMAVTAGKAVSALVIGMALVGMALLFIEAVERLTNMVRTRDGFTAFVASILLALIALAGGYVLFMILRHVVGSPALGFSSKAMVVGVLGATIGVVLLMARLRRTETIALGLETDGDGRGWLLATLGGFLSVTFVFMVMQNPQLDLQTVFIQRVQYVQSHALFALWVGLGVVLWLSVVETLFHGSVVARWTLSALAMGLIPGVPLWKNFHDPYIVTAFGGAEQNGHHYGWYFGNWSLRGAEGVREDLEHEHSPGAFAKVWAAYPDPSYPPAMSTNAIFFGGTDPGRFVPTYMIYSARVRPDVYLITQNALADTTYLNVMRDLYGDPIFIPSVDDSNRAFQEFYANIASGRTSAIGTDIRSDNGRISIEGVGGVMQINGILTRQIFDRNKDRHEFYVEESYMIPWMNDYLTPHGIIMKLNREPTPITDELASRDRAFWNWVIDRFLSDPKFMRDVCAQKSFSKLRTSLAGLYQSRGRFEDAEYAFRQAIQLYPYSPEAVFRLADAYVNRRRFDDARALIQDLKAHDSMNDKLDDFTAFIDRVERASMRRDQLVNLYRASRATPQDVLELAVLCREFNDSKAVESLVRSLLEARAAMGVDGWMQLGELCAQIQCYDLAENVLLELIKLEPQSANWWLKLGTVRAVLNRRPEAIAALRRAVELAGEPVRSAIASNSLLAPLANEPEFRSLLPSARPPPINLPPELRSLIR